MLLFARGHPHAIARHRLSLSERRHMGGLAATTLSIAMIAAIILMGFGFRFVPRREYRKQGTLMIVAGLVILANVLIWTV
jgi:hypothetical protein